MEKVLWLTVLSGGFAGAVFSVGANSCIPCWRRMRLHGGLKFERPELHQRALTVRVHNTYVLPLTECWVYIELNYTLDDIVDTPQGKSAHITTAARFNLKDDRLCWSLNPDTPPKVDIYAGESQSLQILEFDAKKSWIGIFSETRDKPYRVFLRADRVYRGTLKIVCREIKAKEQPICINVIMPDFPDGLLGRG